MRLSGVRSALRSLSFVHKDELEAIDILILKKMVPSVAVIHGNARSVLTRCSADPRHGCLMLEDGIEGSTPKANGEVEVTNSIRLMRSEVWLKKRGVHQA